MDTSLRILVAYLPAISDGKQIHFRTFDPATKHLSDEKIVQLPGSDNSDFVIYSAPSIFWNASEEKIYVYFCGQKGGATEPAWSLFEVVVGVNWVYTGSTDITSRTLNYTKMTQKLTPNLRATPSVLWVNQGTDHKNVATATAGGGKYAVNMFSYYPSHSSASASPTTSAHLGEHSVKADGNDDGNDDDVPTWIVWPINESPSDFSNAMNGPVGAAYEQTYSGFVYLASNTGGSIYVASCDTTNFADPKNRLAENWPTTKIPQPSTGGLGPMITPLVVPGASAGGYHPMLYLLFQSSGSDAKIYSMPLKTGTGEGAIVGSWKEYNSTDYPFLNEFLVSRPGVFDDYGSPVAAVQHDNTIYVAYMWSATNDLGNEYTGISFVSMGVGDDGYLLSNSLQDFGTISYNAMKPALCIVPNDLLGA